MSIIHVAHAQFEQTVVDDKSSADEHYRAVTGLITQGGVHFIMNAQPAFAVNESMTADTLRRINMHGVTTNDEVSGPLL